MWWQTCGWRASEHVKELEHPQVQLGKAVTNTALLRLPVVPIAWALVMRQICNKWTLYSLWKHSYMLLPNNAAKQLISMQSITCRLLNLGNRRGDRGQSMHAQTCVYDWLVGVGWHVLGSKGFLLLLTVCAWHGAQLGAQAAAGAGGLDSG